MKKIKTFLLRFQLFYYLFNFRKIMLFKSFDEKLEESIVDKGALQVILMREISKVMKSFYPKGRSKYIPLSLKERREIKAAIQCQFGYRMQKLHIAINDKLEFV